MYNIYIYINMYISICKYIYISLYIMASSFVKSRRYFHNCWINHKKTCLSHQIPSKRPSGTHSCGDPPASHINNYQRVKSPWYLWKYIPLKKKHSIMYESSISPLIHSKSISSHLSSGWINESVCLTSLWRPTLAHAAHVGTSKSASKAWWKVDTVWAWIPA